MDRRHFYSAALLLLLPLALWADPPKLKIDAEIKPSGEYVRMTPDTDAVAVTYIGLSGLDPFPSEELKDARRFLLHVRGLPAGRYKFAAVGAAKTGEQTRADFAVVVGDVPPGPGPGPEPPGPNPPQPPGPAPIPGDGFKALILYESADLSSLPKEQQAVLYSKQVRDYLNAKCAAGPDGKTKEWRVWDYDSDPAAESAPWQAAMKRKPAKDKLPWLILSNPKKPGGGFEGPLPKTAAEMLDLLKKWGE